MKLILENPIWIDEPVEITNPKIIKTLADYINKPISIETAVIVPCDYGIYYVLGYMKKDRDTHYFKILPRRNDKAYLKKL